MRFLYLAFFIGLISGMEIVMNCMDRQEEVFHEDLCL